MNGLAGYRDSHDSVISGGMDNEPRHPIRPVVDDVTIAWLVEIADLHHADVNEIAAAILRDVAGDDLAAHGVPVHDRGAKNDPSPTLN